jgi:hypothetical protein
MWLNRENLTIRDGLLFYKWFEEWGTNFLLVVPGELNQEVISLCHDLKTSGHLGN